MGTYKCLVFTFHGSISIYSCLSHYYRKDRSMAGIKEENKIPLLAIAILVVFLLLCVACTNTKKTFILDPSITYPEERNVAVAVPVIPVQIDIIE